MANFFLTLVAATCLADFATAAAPVRFPDEVATLRAIPSRIVEDAELKGDSKFFMMQMDAPICRNMMADGGRINLIGQTQKLLLDHGCQGAAYIFAENKINAPGAADYLSGLTSKDIDSLDDLGPVRYDRNDTFRETSLLRLQGMQQMAAAGGCAAGMWAMYVTPNTGNWDDVSEMCDGGDGDCHSVTQPLTKDGPNKGFANKDSVTLETYSITKWNVPASKFGPWLRRATNQGRVKLALGSAQGLTSVEVGVDGVGSKHQQLAGRNNIVLVSGEWRFKDDKLLIDLNSGTFMKHVPCVEAKCEDAQLTDLSEFERNSIDMLQAITTELDQVYGATVQVQAGESIAEIMGSDESGDRSEHLYMQRQFDKMKVELVKHSPECAIDQSARIHYDDLDNIKSLCNLPASPTDTSNDPAGKYPLSSGVPLYPISQNNYAEPINVPAPVCTQFWKRGGKEKACNMVNWGSKFGAGGAKGYLDSSLSLEQLEADIAKLE